MKTLRIISIVLVVTAWAGAALGQAGASVTFEPPTQTVGLGTFADVGIRISNLDLVNASLRGYYLGIVYDPTVLAASLPEMELVFFGDPFLWDQLVLAGPGRDGAGYSTRVDPVTPGLLTVEQLTGASKADLDSLQAPEFILAVVRFSAIGAGTSPLSFTFDSSLTDSGGLPLAATYGTGSVTVTPAPVPVPGAVLLGSLGLGSAGWLLRRKHGMTN